MRRYFNENSPNKEWNLKDISGNKFEDLVSDLIMNQLYKLSGVIAIQTERTDDGGKDIVVISQKEELNILGQTFVLNGKKEIKIFFECKSTKNSFVSHDKVSSSYIRSKYQDIDYYVLVTNSTILPQSYFLIENELSDRQISFKLIDSFLLGTFIAKIATDDFNKTIQNPYDKTCNADFHFEYQVDTFKIQFTNKYEIYMMFRNYTNDFKLCKLELMTDVNWSLDTNEMSFTVSPQGAVVKKITVLQNYFDGIPEMLFRLKINHAESDIILSGIKDKIIFEPPFFGESRKNLIDALSNQIKSNQPPSIICFWGDAGIGKTRIVEELLSKLTGTIFEFFECKIVKGQKDFEYRITEFLKKKDYVHADSNENFSSLINSCHKEYRHAIIFIDDFHNCPSEFYEQIKKIKTFSKDITLIICGRTDFSVGNIDYLSFVKWVKDNLKHSYEIAPLEDRETKNLIKAIINGVPLYALNRLHRLSMNNPLYIVQYIEYMLDLKIFQLLTRNTVGIIDVNKFHENRYIPKEIEKLYELRIENLLKLSNGVNLLEFLYQLALCDGKFHRDDCFHYFDCAYNYIDILIERRFIQNSAEITFIHESLYLYIKKRINVLTQNDKKQLSENILNKKEIEKQLNRYQLGRLNVYAGNDEEALKQFQPIISWLQSVDNISNLNVNLFHYDYLLDVFELAQRNSSFHEIAKKSLLARIYITLHHFAPIKAVNECDTVTKLLQKCKWNDDKKILLSISELKAHAFMNSGLYINGETLLKEIQANWLINKETLDDKTLFDMYDRLASVYRHYNLKELATKYNELSKTLADNMGDAQLQTLAKRTQYAPVVIQNFKPAQIQIIIGFNSCYLLKGDRESLTKAGNFVEKAINLSMTFGIVAFMWRLYNLDAIIKIRLNFEMEIIHKTFNTVFDILQKRGLLYLGNCDLTHGNILALSNYGFHIQERNFESFFYKRMSLVTFNENNIKLNNIQYHEKLPLKEYLVQQYKLARDRKVLFVKSQPKLLRDSQTGFIIII